MQLSAICWNGSQFAGSNVCGADWDPPITYTIMSDYPQQQFRTKYSIMNSDLPSILSTDYSSLLGDWQPCARYLQAPVFQNSLSLDLCKFSTHTVTIKDLDIYSSRHSYSYVFTPRIYKHVMKSSQCGTGSLITFNVDVFTEFIEETLQTAQAKSNLECLPSKLKDVVRGCKYLAAKYGPFGLTAKMIGWTRDSVSKVWFNEDFSLNAISKPVSTQLEMIKDIVKLFKFVDVWRYVRLQQVNTLKQLLEILQGVGKQPAPRNSVAKKCKKNNQFVIPTMFFRNPHLPNAENQLTNKLQTECQLIPSGILKEVESTGSCLSYIKRRKPNGQNQGNILGSCKRIATETNKQDKFSQQVSSFGQHQNKVCAAKIELGAPKKIPILDHWSQDVSQKNRQSEQSTPLQSQEMFEISKRFSVGHMPASRKGGLLASQSTDLLKCTSSSNPLELHSPWTRVAHYKIAQRQEEKKMEWKTQSSPFQGNGWRNNEPLARSNSVASSVFEVQKDLNALFNEQKVVVDYKRLERQLDRVLN